jgi:hypothetical protein
MKYYAHINLVNGESYQTPLLRTIKDVTGLVVIKAKKFAEQSKPAIHEVVICRPPRRGDRSARGRPRIHGFYKLVDGKLVRDKGTIGLEQINEDLNFGFSR